MEFLKTALGGQYELFCEKIAAYNKDNPEAEIRLANVAEGGWISPVEAENFHNHEDFMSLKNEKNALEKQLETVKFDNVVEIALIRAGAKNTKAVSALLDFESRDIDEVIDKIEAVKKENPFLFEGAHLATGMPQGSPAANTTQTDEIRSALFGKN